MSAMYPHRVQGPFRQGVCKFRGQMAVARGNKSYRRICINSNRKISDSLQDLYKVDPQIVSGFKNLLSKSEKQEFFAKHHNLTHGDLMMQILPAVSETRKKRCIDGLGAEGKTVYEDDIKDKYADADESMVKNTLDNGINVQCPTGLTRVWVCTALGVPWQGAAAPQLEASLPVRFAT